MTTTGLTIRPLEVHVPDEDLADLRRRLAATRWSRSTGNSPKPCRI